ncbi:MAG: dipeptide epimerase [Bacteroidota bacterium]
MNLSIHPYDLPLAEPFGTSHGMRTVQPTLIVKLIDEDGIFGLGEAPLTSYYGLETTACQAVLRAFAPTLAHWIPTSLADIERLHELAADLHPFLRCALDVAAHDYLGKRLGLSVRALWGAPDTKGPPTSYTIGLDTPDRMLEKVRDVPWPIYKIKLGSDRDLEAIQLLRTATDAPFLIDANTGWSYEQALDLIPKLADLGVEMIEQPLPAHDFEGHRQLRDAVDLPIIADESCQGLADMVRCASAFDGINVKITKAGGLLPARKMIDKAQLLGMEVMAGCMTESSVGISANAQLLPWLDRADFDGAMLLAKDPAEGVKFDAAGHVVWGKKSGIGVELLK